MTTKGFPISPNMVVKGVTVGRVARLGGIQLYRAVWNDDLQVKQNTSGRVFCTLMGIIISCWCWSFFPLTNQNLVQIGWDQVPSVLGGFEAFSDLAIIGHTWQLGLHDLCLFWVFVETACPFITHSLLFLLACSQTIDPRERQWLMFILKFSKTMMTYCNTWPNPYRKG